MLHGAHLRRSISTGITASPVPLQTLLQDGGIYAGGRRQEAGTSALISLIKNLGTQMQGHGGAHAL